MSAVSLVAPGPRRLYVPELAVSLRPDFRDNPRWDVDCEGGPGGRNVVLTVNRRTGRLATNPWRCKENHLGCREWRWERQRRWLRKVVTAPVLFVVLAPGGEWARFDHRREYLERKARTPVGYAWVLHASGVRFVVAEVDLTPWKSPWRMRPAWNADAIRLLGWHHVKASAVQRQVSKGWAPKKESSMLARGRGDRVTKARLRTGLGVDRLPAPVMDQEIDQARERLEVELAAEGDRMWDFSRSW